MEDCPEVGIVKKEELVIYGDVNGVREGGELVDEEDDFTQDPLSFNFEERDENERNDKPEMKPCFSQLLLCLSTDTAAEEEDKDQDRKPVIRATGEIIDKPMPKLSCSFATEAEDVKPVIRTMKGEEDKPKALSPPPAEQLVKPETMKKGTVKVSMGKHRRIYSSSSEDDEDNHKVFKDKPKNKKIDRNSKDFYKKVDQSKKTLEPQKRTEVVYPITPLGRKSNEASPMWLVPIDWQNKSQNSLRIKQEPIDPENDEFCPIKIVNVVSLASPPRSPSPPDLQFQTMASSCASPSPSPPSCFQPMMPSLLTTLEAHSDFPHLREISPFPFTPPTPPNLRLFPERPPPQNELLPCGVLTSIKSLQGFHPSLLGPTHIQYQLKKQIYVKNFTEKCDGRCVFLIFKHFGVIRNIQLEKRKQNNEILDSHAVVTFAKAFALSAVFQGRDDAIFKHWDRYVCVSKIQPKNNETACIPSFENVTGPSSLLDVPLHSSFQPISKKPEKEIQPSKKENKLKLKVKHPQETEINRPSKKPRYFPSFFDPNNPNLVLPDPKANSSSIWFRKPKVKSEPN